MTDKEIIKRALQCARDAHICDVQSLAVNDDGDIYMVVDQPTNQVFYLAENIEQSRKLIKTSFLDWYIAYFI